MSTVLVTGGAGYIGSHVCMSLVEKGYKVYAIDSYVNSNEKTFAIINSNFKNNKIRYFHIDLAQSNQISNVFQSAIEQDSNIDSVIHLAGLKSVKQSLYDPLAYWNSNVKGTINLLHNMKKFNCNNIVFSSSATVYGNNYSFPISEDLAKNPISVYGRTKLTVEQILNDLFFSQKEIWRIANLRYFNPIGAHPSGLIGENSCKNSNNLFPKLCDVAYGKFDFLEIYGNNWSTRDGTPIRDYIHVMDIAEAHISALDFLIYNDPQIIDLNLGSGKGTSVLELINIFEIANNVKINYVFKKKREGDAPVYTASIEKAKNMINWEPSRNLFQMCKDGWSWYLKNLA